MPDAAYASPFFALQEPVLRDLLFASIGRRLDEHPVLSPAQGVNNSTFLVGPAGEGGVVLKLRPISSHSAPVNSPFWPNFTRVIWGDKPNGDIRSLDRVSECLRTHGKIRVPKVLHINHTLEQVPAPFTITEMLPGSPFDWDAHPMDREGAEQLGRHLGRLHRALPSAGFGVFEGPLRSGAEWWDRFSEGFRALLDLLAGFSPVVGELAPELRALLERAVETGTPECMSLICIDQAPSHYLREIGGGVSAMIDIEGHLWGPVEYELAIVSLWVRNFDAFKLAYAAEGPWPSAYEATADAYRVFTWLQWLYCMRVLTPNEETARNLEEKLPGLFEPYKAPSPSP